MRLLPMPLPLKIVFFSANVLPLSFENATQKEVIPEASFSVHESINSPLVVSANRGIEYVFVGSRSMGETAKLALVGTQVVNSGVLSP
ncbi:MAG TPA: hypothetical protein DCR35_21745 [Runella sp.]|nr:hypothetical protein [Runella sp.]HAO51709.1 hypothetical protein [Runella sp.]